MAFYNDQYSSSLDVEITTLCREAIDQLKKVDADSNQKKKQIITELARNLEEKVISLNTICIEIVNQLRGFVSESFVRKCLDQKYKDSRRSQNAKQQQDKLYGIYNNKQKPTSEKLTDIDLNRTFWEDSQSELVDNSNVIENLALQGALDQPDEEKNAKEDANQVQEVIIADTKDGQTLIQMNKNNSNDDESKSYAYPHHDSIAPLDEDNISSSPTIELLLFKSLENEEPIGCKSSRCPNCNKKDEIIDFKNEKIEQLEQVIRESTQLTSAYKLVNKRPKHSENKKI